jgi:hypothetical protein
MGWRDILAAFARHEYWRRISANFSTRSMPFIAFLFDYKASDALGAQKEQA